MPQALTFTPFQWWTSDCWTGLKSFWVIQTCVCRHRFSCSYELQYGCLCFSSLSQLPKFSWWYWMEARFHLMQNALHLSAPKRFWEIQCVGTSIPNHFAVKGTNQAQFKSNCFFSCSGNNITTNTFLEYRNSWILHWLNITYWNFPTYRKQNIGITMFGLIPNKYKLSNIRIRCGTECLYILLLQ